MAECGKGRVAESEPSQFCCSVCLDQLKDPVTIPCGHSYCKSCIKGFWDQNEEKGNYSCPQCRETFSPRPVLRRNNMLAEVVEMLQKTSTQQASPSLTEAVTSPSDISCDFCETNPNKATMSCLTCVASYCPDHLKPHYSVPVLKKHQLVPATVPLQEKMCSKHNKLMEVYCRTDQKCICYLCMVDEHKSHSTVSTAAEREEQQKQLTQSQKEIQERGKKREKELTALLEVLKDFKMSSQTAVDTSDKIFDEMISSFAEKRSLVKQLILAQEKKVEAQAEGLQLQLEGEISKLRKRDTDLEQISNIVDHVHFIQTFQSLSAACESSDLPKVPVVYPKDTFQTVTDSMSKLRDGMEGLMKEMWPLVTAKVSSIHGWMQPEPKTKEEFLSYCRPLKLDGNSVSPEMTLSQKRLRVTLNPEMIPFCSGYGGYGHSSRSYVIRRGTDTEQVWCTEALSEQCYWEVNFYGATWCVAVSYKDNSETSTYQSEFGLDNRSWSLECSPQGCSFQHNNENIHVSDRRCWKIGVYLNYPQGTLSFYGVSGKKMTLLHKVDATFTEPVYPCIGFKEDGSNRGDTFYAELVKLWR